MRAAAAEADDSQTQSHREGPPAVAVVAAVPAILKPEVVCLMWPLDHQADS